MLSNHRDFSGFHKFVDRFSSDLLTSVGAENNDKYERPEESLKKKSAESVNRSEWNQHSTEEKNSCFSESQVHTELKHQEVNKGSNLNNHEYDDIPKTKQDIFVKSSESIHLESNCKPIANYDVTKHGITDENGRTEPISAHESFKNTGVDFESQKTDTAYSACAQSSTKSIFKNSDLISTNKDEKREHLDCIEDLPKISTVKTTYSRNESIKEETVGKEVRNLINEFDSNCTNEGNRIPSANESTEKQNDYLYNKENLSPKHIVISEKKLILGFPSLPVSLSSVYHQNKPTGNIRFAQINSIRVPYKSSSPFQLKYRNPLQPSVRFSTSQNNCCIVSSNHSPVNSTVPHVPTQQGILKESVNAEPFMPQKLNSELIITQSVLPAEIVNAKPFSPQKSYSETTLIDSTLSSESINAEPFSPQKLDISLTESTLPPETVTAEPFLPQKSYSETSITLSSESINAEPFSPQKSYSETSMIDSSESINAEPFSLQKSCSTEICKTKSILSPISINAKPFSPQKSNISLTKSTLPPETVTAKPFLPQNQPNQSSVHSSFTEESIKAKPFLLSEQLSTNLLNASKSIEVMNTIGPPITTQTTTTPRPFIFAKPFEPKNEEFSRKTESPTLSTCSKNNQKSEHQESVSKNSVPINSEGAAITTSLPVKSFTAPPFLPKNSSSTKLPLSQATDPPSLEISSSLPVYKNPFYSSRESGTSTDGYPILQSSEMTTNQLSTIRQLHPVSTSTSMFSATQFSARQSVVRHTSISEYHVTELLREVSLTEKSQKSDSLITSSKTLAEDPTMNVPDLKTMATETTSPSFFTNLIKPKDHWSSSTLNDETDVTSSEKENVTNPPNSSIVTIERQNVFGESSAKTQVRPQTYIQQHQPYAYPPPYQVLHHPLTPFVQPMYIPVVSPQYTLSQQHYQQPMYVMPNRQFYSPVCTSFYPPDNTYIMQQKQLVNRPTSEELTTSSKSSPTYVHFTYSSPDSKKNT